jgi:predicted TIM-barrel fold metal-dependent hydrolase
MSNWQDIVSAPPACPPLVDGYCHFAPGALLTFLERASGRRHPFHDLFDAKPILTDRDRRLAFMDAHAVDASVLVPLPWIESLPDVHARPAQAAAAARVCNDALAELASARPRRLFTVALVPTTTPDVMVRELDRAVTELGCVGCMIAVGPTARRVDDPSMEPLFKRAVELDVPIWLHPSRPAACPDYVDEEQSRYLHWIALGWLQDTSLAMERIVFSGLFERYPTLKIITHHLGGLIPLFAARMQVTYDAFEGSGLDMGVPLRRPYVAHFRNFYCDTATAAYEPLLLRQALTFFGPDRMIFGTDTPMDHEEGSFLASSRRGVADLALPETEAAGVFSANILRLINRAL